MSKSNINPNHYKVAGRERQGEDIAQARNKQKHAENVASRRTETGARSQKPAPQLGAALPGVAPAQTAKQRRSKHARPPCRRSPGRSEDTTWFPVAPHPTLDFRRSPGAPPSGQQVPRPR